MKSKGFTLIELLIVVAIIGILSTVVLSSLATARVRARDAKRIADIRTIQSALEIYANDNNGGYPLPNSSWAGSHTSAWTELETTLGTTLPTDPLNSSTGSGSTDAISGNYVYSYFARDTTDTCSGGAYMLIFNLEGKNGNGTNDGVTFCRPSPRLFYAYNDSFVVGMNQNGRLTVPDLSGTAK